jgi:hypothetical protein
LKISRRVLLAAFAIFFLSTLVVFAQNYQQPIPSSTVGGTQFQDVKDGTWIKWNHPLYTSTAPSPGFEQIGFTCISFVSSLAPCQTFNVFSTGGNATITGIDAGSVTFLESQASGKIENLTYYYSQAPLAVYIFNGGSQIATVSQSSFITSFASWSATPGNNVYWNSASGYVETKTTVSSATVILSFAPPSPVVTVIITLTNGNSGSGNQKLLAPDYMLVTYTLGGQTQTLDAVDGSNSFTADPYTQVTINGIDNAATGTTRLCLASCLSQGFNTGSASSLSITYNYYTQVSIQVKDSGLPYPDSFLQTVGQLPTFSYVSTGAQTKTNLFSTFQSNWMDNNSAWSVPNPTFIDLHYFNPSPASGTITNRSSITISYSASTSFPSGGSCTSNNLFTLLLNTCLFSVFYYTWYNIFGSFGFGIILMGINLALYNKTENPNLVVLGMIVEGAVLGVILPQFFLPLAAIFVVVGLSGALYQVIREK